MKIALISDTHVREGQPLPQRLLERIRGVDHILHAGDLVTLGILKPLNAIAPTTAVTGNMDPPEVLRTLPAQQTIHLAGHAIGLKHGHQRSALQSQYIRRDYGAPEFQLFYQAMATQLPDAAIIVFGHFHEPVVKRWKDRLFVNPGAMAGRSPTFALLELGVEVEVRIVELNATV
jgi:putative phosphoesterase